MKERRIKGIVISSIDYKEKDKLLTIFSLERGLVTAKLTGIKNQKAKMKPFKEVFCFADFDLIDKNDFSTIISGEIIGSFYNIVKDLDKYFAGCTVLEILKTIAKYGEKDEVLFVETLKALKTLAYDSVAPQLILMKFLIKIFEAMGYRLALNKCSSCAQNFIGKRFFNFAVGEITCSSCKGLDSEIIEPVTHSTLRIVSMTDYDKLKSLKITDEGMSSAINLLFKNFSQRFDYVLRTVNKFH